MAMPARAAMLVTIAETGAGVAVTGSGTVNLAALTRVDFDIWVSSVIPGSGVIFSGGRSDLYEAVNGNFQFGGDGSGIFATSSSGSAFAIGLLAIIAVPEGYVSGDRIDFSMVFAGQTLSSMTIVPTATYVWSWGSGSTADTVTLRIGNAVAAVPEPASGLLLGAGLLGLAGLRRRG
jgi:hypothetical protein